MCFMKMLTGVGWVRAGCQARAPGGPLGFHTLQRAGSEVKASRKEERTRTVLGAAWLVEAQPSSTFRGGPEGADGHML